MSKNNDEKTTKSNPNDTGITSKNSITDYYTLKRKELDDEERELQNKASITKAKLEKYLPYQLKAQGLANTGASESTLIQADNNYMNSLAQISANHQKQMNELAMYEREELASESMQNYTLLEGKVQEMLEKYVDESGNISSENYSAIEKYINDNSHMLTPQDKERLKTALHGYTRYEEPDIPDNLKVKTYDKMYVTDINDTGSSNGDNFSITIGNAEFKVERGAAAPAKISQAINEQFTRANKTASDGELVVYDGKLYALLPDESGTNRWTLVNGRATALEHALANFAGESVDVVYWDKLTKGLGLSNYIDND